MLFLKFDSTVALPCNQLLISTLFKLKSILEVVEKEF